LGQFADILRGETDSRDGIKNYMQSLLDGCQLEGGECYVKR
jgi:hypothetical protein